MIATNGKKACVIMDGDKVVTKILVLQPVYELEGDLLLKFAVDVKKGTTLFMTGGSTEVTANDDYKAGDYLYFSKGTFHPTRVRFNNETNASYDYYSDIRFLKGFDASKIRTMYHFFGGWFNNGENGLKKAKSIIFDECDTSNVTNTSAMFSYCRNVESIDISKFDTSSITTFRSMILECNALTSIDVSGWNTSKVTDIYKLFSYCSSLTSLDVSNFDTSNVTDMRNMFSGCSSLTNLLFGAKWGTQTSTAANALTLDLLTLGSSKSYKLTDATYTSMLTMYDRASAGLTTMTIKFSKSHNLPDGFAEKMSALGYTIQLV